MRDKHISQRMAVSPLIVPPGSSERTNPANKHKIWPSGITSNGNNSDGTPTSNSAGPDLAEQMNEQVKRRYVKGTLVRLD